MSGKRMKLGNKEYNLKNGAKMIVETRVDKEEKDYYVLQAIIEDCGKNITCGHLLYYFDNNTAWLGVIKVDEKYGRQGVGSVLLNQFEDDVRKHNIKTIEGIYIPDKKRQGVDKFYAKHGYTITKSTGDFKLSKTLCLSAVKSDLTM